MVRATRSTQLALEDPPTVAQPITPTSPAKKAPVKKRKRTSDNDDITLADSQQDDKTSAESEHGGDKEDVKERPPIGKRQKTKQQPKEEQDDPVKIGSLPPPTHTDAGETPLSATDADNLLIVLEA